MAGGVVLLLSAVQLHFSAMLPADPAMQPAEPTMQPAEPLVNTSFGRIKGSILKSRDGRDYISFTGIPYTQPPLGHRRFMPPVRAEPWTGVLNATGRSPPCTQMPFGKFLGQEDCLYLNINTPNVSGSLPVMFYIHEGGFREGNAGPAEVGAYFMDEDVVLVAIHYRLGIYGFLSLENEELPGNMGLKDMVMALEWVRSEIHNFGGNPDLITVFGISAGGAAADYLCGSPRTSKLVKGCISQSGVAGSFWSLKTRGEARKAALKSAELLGCTEEGLLACLQNKTVEYISSTLPQDEMFPFVPSIESPSPDAVIPSWPPKETNFPWIVGHTANEGVIKSGYVQNFQNSSELDVYVEGNVTHLANEFIFRKNEKLKAKRIHDRFFIHNDPYTGVEKLYTEAAFIYPALKEIMNHSGPKYYYVFNYTGGPSMLEIIANRMLNVTGSAHTDEEPYLFNFPDNFKLQGWPSQKDVAFSKTLIKLWVNFATTQDPNLKEDFEWDQYGEGQYLYLSNDQISMKNVTMINEIIEFWDSIYDDV